MKLLFVEGDPAHSNWFTSRLEECGYVVETVSSPDQILRDGLNEFSQAVIIDVEESVCNAGEVVRFLRKEGVTQPLMILSVRDNWQDMIDCLDAGADDYLIKPVRSDVVAARLRAIIRRRAGNSTDQIVLGDVELDLKAWCAWLAGECLNLTRNEFRLLRLFLLQPERVLSQQDIHRQLYPEKSDYSPNAIEVQVARLRRKVGRCRIRTMRGLGYCYTPGPGPVQDACVKEPCKAYKRCGCNPTKTAPLQLIQSFAS